MKPAERIKTIGFIIDRIDEVGSYQSTLWRSVSKAAQESGFNTITFTGGPLRLNRSKKSFLANPIYNLASNHNLDGLIICSLIIGSEVGTEKTKEFCRGFTNLPVVNIGLIVENIPSLVIDNKLGIRSAVAHLVEFHKKRRIAFIGGPPGNFDAQQRLQGFLEIIRDYGIEADPRLLAQGNFERPSGRKATETFLNLKNAQIDAIIAANDNMALGVLEVLSEHRMNVPSEIALIGFDDIEDAKSTLPPLTSVRQPLYEIGKLAIDLIKKQIEGKKVDQKIVFPTQMIIRQTCGCGFESDIETGQIAGHFSAGNRKVADQLEQKYLFQITQIMNDSAAGLEDFSDQSLKLMNAFIETIQNPDLISGLLNAVFDVARRIYYKADMEPAWYKLIAVFSEYAVASAESPQELHTNMRVCSTLAEIFGKISWLSTSAYRLKNERKTEPLRRISDSLVSTFDTRELMNTLAATLPGLGISRCWTTIFLEKKSLENNRLLILAYDQSTRIPIPRDGFIYSAGQFIPDQFRKDGERNDLIVTPLKFKEKIFGFSVFGMDIRDLSIFEMLSNQISTAYQGAIAVKELKLTQEKLHEQATIDLLTQAYNRRYFLELADPTFNLALRYKRPLSLILFDIDKFKIINDQFGHRAGDMVLQSTINNIKNSIRTPDVLARYGGDEFILIMPETTHEDAVQTAERLRFLVEEQDIVEKGKKIQTTISLGVVFINHAEDQTLDTLIDRADKALYEAKQKGKNTVMAL